MPNKEGIEKLRQVSKRLVTKHKLSSRHTLLHECQIKYPWAYSMVSSFDNGNDSVVNADFLLKISSWFFLLEIKVTVSASA